MKTCNPDTKPICRLRNLGSETIRILDIAYDINGTLQSFSWTGELKSFEHLNLELSTTTLAIGENTIQVSLNNINKDKTDQDLDNNRDTVGIKVFQKGISLPVSEDFEGTDFPSQDWDNPFSGNVISWFYDEGVGKNSNNSMFCLNTILLFYNKGVSEEMITPVLDFTTFQNPAITFDVAYNYHKYTPPYFTSDMIFADTLEVLISTDCGETFEQVFKKGGAELATATNPILNPLNLNACKFIPADNEWRKEFIDLSNYTGNENTVVKFSYISDLGGSINIDNINFLDGSTIGIEDVPINDFVLYPNPVFGITTLSINNEIAGNLNISLFDLLGKEVKHISCGLINSGVHQIKINTLDLNSGFYFVRIHGENIDKILKLIVE